MRHLYQKARKVFPGTKIIIRETCSVDGQDCRRCYEKCTLRELSIFSFNRNKKIGWFDSSGRIQKTNPKPSKRYLKNVLGIVKERKRRKGMTMNEGRRTSVHSRVPRR